MTSQPQYLLEATSAVFREETEGGCHHQFDTLFGQLFTQLSQQSQTILSLDADGYSEEDITAFLDITINRLRCVIVREWRETLLLYAQEKGLKLPWFAPRNGQAARFRELRKVQEERKAPLIWTYAELFNFLPNAKQRTATTTTLHFPIEVLTSLHQRQAALTPPRHGERPIKEWMEIFNKSRWEARTHLGLQGYAAAYRQTEKGAALHYYKKAQT